MSCMSSMQYTPRRHSVCFISCATISQKLNKESAVCLLSIRLALCVHVCVVTFPLYHLQSKPALWLSLFRESMCDCSIKNSLKP